jgi:hypothetical protein
MYYRRWVSEVRIRRARAARTNYGTGKKANHKEKKKTAMDRTQELDVFTNHINSHN